MRIRLGIFVIVCLSIFPKFAKSQDIHPHPKTVEATRTHNPIHIDGSLNEKAWKEAPVITGLKQRTPNEGANATEKSIIKVLYDNQALYVGAILEDNAPDSIIARLGRRDTYHSSDRFTVYLDPYNDNESGYYFGVNAAGTIMDGTMYGDYHDSDSWDGVWSRAIKMTDRGWIVEMRIPFSQLRFQNKNKNVWGVNFQRQIARKNERDYLQYVPKQASGFVSFFPDLKGINQIHPPGYFEVVPYVTSKAAYQHFDAGNPFHDGADYNFNAGADIRTTIFDDLMLNATINPDFGQVEVDPAVVNLSDVETFYPEKRPFFIDGSNFFNFGNGGTAINLNLNWPSPNFFYSRRIGRSPQGSIPDADYVDYPDASHILGAAKVTGRMEGNWNVGVLQAITSREHAKYAVNGNISNVNVQPLTYYGVGRIEKKFHNSSSIGLMSTYSSRNFERNTLRDQINNSALFIGTDGYTYLDREHSYVISGWAGASNITGTRNRMLDLQTNQVHYLQRPDLRNYGVDSSATSLSGYGGYITMDKQRGKLLFISSLGMLSPNFDINDMGYLSHSDVINALGSLGLHWTDPKSWYREILMAGAFFHNWDFEGNDTGKGTWWTWQMTLPNYMDLNINFFHEFQFYDNRLTRGGPLALNKGGSSINLNMNTDSRKKWLLGSNINYYNGNDGSKSISVGPRFTWQPATNVSLSLEPQYERNRQTAHYIDTFEDPYATKTYGHRFVFAHLDQKTFSSAIRMNWTFTPALSLQMYVQPLIAAGTYTDYKELKRPKSYDFKIYGTQGSTYNPETHMADPDGNGPAHSFDVGAHNFNYKSLRGNAVLRWQYRPGSTIYLVWTQTRSASSEIGRFQLDQSLNHLLNIKPDNIFLVKWTYWFNL